MKRSVLIVLLFALTGIPSPAQTDEAKASVEAARRAGKVSGTPMQFEVLPDGDTVFVDVLDPVWVFPKGRRPRGDDWRKDYKLVYNFNKVYPFALVGRKMMAQVDSTISADVSKKAQRSQYVNDVERELFFLFEKDIRKMTISQGLVLMRLVDRECGMSAYEIIKTYESGFAAGFWQLVAKLFSQDLKTKYDPEGKDKKLEQLVQKWDSGQWDSFYYSIFMEYPEKVVFEVDSLRSAVKKKNR
ncbi:MAG: DUF4294 domain-containing protein [Bacteroidales bacterium]|nr:DUF4294 domain-containing protein [Bacteroidales bacterium]